VVGLLASKGDFKPLLNIDEVDAIFDAPLEMFLKVFLLLNLFNFELPTFSWVIIHKPLCEEYSFTWVIQALC
jgi:hypothetical protein